MAEKQSPRLVDSGPAVEKAGLVHRVYIPEGPGPFPTAVMIHGLKGNEDVMWIFQRVIPSDWLITAPRAIKAVESGGYAWHLRQDDEWPTLEIFEEAVTAVYQFISSLPDLYNADPDKIVLIGFSQGTATAIAAATDYPDLVRGIASLVGFAPEEYEEMVGSAALNALPIFMAAGTSDERIPIERSRKSAEVLGRGGGVITYNEYDTGHKLNGAGMRALKTWLTDL